jgi:hypothetical protein
MPRYMPAGLHTKEEKRQWATHSSDRQASRKWSPSNAHIAADVVPRKTKEAMTRPAFAATVPVKSKPANPLHISRPAAKRRPGGARRVCPGCVGGSYDGIGSSSYAPGDWTGAGDAMTFGLRRTMCFLAGLRFMGLRLAGFADLDFGCFHSVSYSPSTGIFAN